MHNADAAHFAASVRQILAAQTRSQSLGGQVVEPVEVTFDSRLGQLVVVGGSVAGGCGGEHRGIAGCRRAGTTEPGTRFYKLANAAAADACWIPCESRLEGDENPQSAQQAAEVRGSRHRRPALNLSLTLRLIRRLSPSSERIFRKIRYPARRLPAKARAKSTNSNPAAIGGASELVSRSPANACGGDGRRGDVGDSFAPRRHRGGHKCRIPADRHRRACRAERV